MNGELHLIGDGSGLALLGAQPDVERFLSAEGLPSRDLGLGRMRAAANLGSTLLQESALVAQESGRWVKLTKESAQQVKEYGLRESSASGLSTGVLKGEKGRIKGFVEIAQSPVPCCATPPLSRVPAGCWRKSPCSRPWTR